MILKNLRSLHIPDSIPSIPHEAVASNIMNMNKQTANAVSITANNNNDEKPDKDKKDKKEKKPTYLYLCTTKCRYVVVKKACRQLGFKM